MEIENFFFQEALVDVQFPGEEVKKRCMTSEKGNFTNVR